MSVEGIPLIHIGKSVPKDLLAAGWVEKSAQHIGRGVWLFRCEKAPSDPSGLKSDPASFSPKPRENV